MNAARTIARLGAAGGAAPPRVPGRRAAHRRLPRPLRARHLAGVRVDARARASQFRGVEADVVAGATLLGLNDVRDALPRHDPRRLPHARRGPRRRRARPAAAAAGAAGAAPHAAAGALRVRRAVCARLRDRRLPDRDGDHLGARRLVARPPARARARPRRRGRDPRARSRSPARSSSPRPPTASPSSWSSAPASSPACSARSARRSAPTRSRTSPTSRAGCCRSRRSTRSALAALTSDTVGFTRLAIDLGPFGGAEDFGPLLWPWAIVYLGLVGALALPASRAAISSGLEPVVDLQRRALDGVRRLGASAGCSTPSAWASSPDSYISVTMSQPPTSSPLTNSWGIVGQLEMPRAPGGCAGRAGCRRRRTARRGPRGPPTVRAEKPHIGRLGRALHEEDDLVVADRLLDGVADGVLGDSCSLRSGLEGKGVDGAADVGAEDA